MTIYNIEDYLDKQNKATFSKPPEDSSDYIKEQLKGFSQAKMKGKKRFFSSLAARAFFFLLLVADIVWGVYSIVLFAIKLVVNILTIFMVQTLRDSLKRTWLSIIRSIICMISLSLALFSPALGIMFACLYFLMYDKSGVEEIVPLSLRDQFKDFFPS